MSDFSSFCSCCFFFALLFENAKQQMCINILDLTILKTTKRENKMRMRFYAINNGLYVLRIVLILTHWNISTHEHVRFPIKWLSSLISDAICNRVFWLRFLKWEKSHVKKFFGKKWLLIPMRFSWKLSLVKLLFWKEELQYRNGIWFKSFDFKILPHLNQSINISNANLISIEKSVFLLICFSFSICADLFSFF